MKKHLVFVAGMLLNLLPLTAAAAVCGNPVKLSYDASANYTSIQTAYDSAKPGAEILVSAEQQYQENLIFDSNGVELSGGWDCLFKGLYYPYSTINGSLTISGLGASIIERIALGPGAPSAPTGLTVTPIDKSSTSLHLSWSNTSSDETGLKVMRSGDNITFTEVASLGAGATWWDDTGRSPCTTYYYRVYAYNASGNSDNAGGSGLTAPAAPTDLFASFGLPLLAIGLDWTASSCASQYKIYQCDNANYTYTMIGMTGGLWADVTELAPHVYLFYRISAVDSSGHEGASSCTVAANHAWGGATSPGDTCRAAVGWAASPAPQNPWASQGNFTNQVQVGWNAVQVTWNGYLGASSDTWATFYRIYYAYSNSSTPPASWTYWTDVAAPNPNSSPMSVTFTGMSPNTYIWFKIITAAPSTYDTYPAYVRGYTGSSVSNVPATPSIYATQYYPGLIMVGWSSVAGATGYYLERSLSQSSGYTEILTNYSGTSYYDSSVTPWTTYWYRVRAHNASGYSGYSVADFGNASSP